MNGADAVDILAEIIGPKGRRILAIMFILGILIFRNETIHLFNWLVTQRAHELTNAFLHAATPPKT